MVRHVALVSQSKAVSPSLVSSMAAALQQQVTRDFSPLWNVQATISYFPKLPDVPVGYWPIIIRDTLDDPGAGGYHTDKNRQPYALIRSDGSVSITASHECLEMLADPFGNRTVAGDSIKPGQGRVEYLLEICDPCEAEAFAYSVNGLPVSDFFTPHFHDPVAAPGVRYSYTGAVTRPRELLKGGYISWLEPVTGEMWQAFYFTSKISYRNLGRPPGGMSLREWVDRQTRPELAAHAPTKARPRLAVQANHARASLAKSESLTALIGIG